MNIIGWVYTICFAICYIPQIIKSIRTKRVDDISISLFILSLAGYICACIYTIDTIGINVILLTNYIFGATCSLTMMVIYFMYRNRLNTNVMSDTNFSNSSYYQFLKQEQQEIEKLKRIESEKVGRDIGDNKAVFLWTKNYRTKWIDSLPKR